MSIATPLSRRDFLAATAGLTATACLPTSSPSLVAPQTEGFKLAADPLTSFRALS